MKTMEKVCHAPVEAKLTWKKVRNSTKVAEWYWGAALMLVMLAGSAENIGLTMVGVALLASATLHRMKVEKKNKK